MAVTQTYARRSCMMSRFQQERQCYICLGDESDETDDDLGALLSPCRCASRQIQGVPPLQPHASTQTHRRKWTRVLTG